MGLGDVFKLAKLTIEAYKDVARTPPAIDDLEVMYNPETLTITYASVLQEVQNTKVWRSARSPNLNVKLVFDGTGVSFFGVEQLFGLETVAERVQAFLDLCYTTQPESHEPAFLVLKWSADVLGKEGFHCRLQSVSVQYTLFDRDGAPLRAELTAEFAEALDPAKMAAKARLSSPDLTHRRVVRTGDTLPLLCREIYGSPVHHLRVAEVNGLDDPRALVPGQELIFPPFARKERG